MGETVIRRVGIPLSIFVTLLIMLQSWTGGATAWAQSPAEKPFGHDSTNNVGDTFARPAVAKTAVSMEIAERTRQAAELRLKWHLSEAESLWLQVLNRDENNCDALIGLAEIERTRLNYPQAFRYLDHAAEAVMENSLSQAQLLIAYGSLYLTLEEPDKAASYFARAREIAPQYYGTILGQAGVAILKRDYSRAESLLEDLQRTEPRRVEVYVGLARVYLEENRNALAAQEAQKAMEMDRYNVDAMAALCAVRVAEKKPEAVRKLAKNVLELNPFNNGVRRLLSQYLNSKKAYQMRFAQDVQQLLARADAYKDVGKSQEAITDYRQVLLSEPKAIRAWLGLGACYLAAREYKAVINCAEKALALDGDSALAHLQLALAHNGIHELMRIEAGATDWRSRYFLSSVHQFDGLSDVFINYNSLTRAEKQVIEQAVAPLAHFIPELRKKGAKHLLLPVDKKLSDIIGYESLENRMTFDGRYYASVRGVGGLVTVSGVEYLDVAMRGGFNTIAHEFAHQVHTTALSNEMTDRIKKLYQRALKDGKVLDYYAASNEWEYFAQGYEAYISDFKRPNAGVTARHTHEELQQQDPELFYLFEELSGKINANEITSKSEEIEQ